MFFKTFQRNNATYKVNYRKLDYKAMKCVYVQHQLNLIRFQFV